jgi:hypothetical protein
MSAVVRFRGQRVSQSAKAVAFPVCQIAGWVGADGAQHVPIPLGQEPFRACLVFMETWQSKIAGFRRGSNAFFDSIATRYPLIHLFRSIFTHSRVVKHACRMRGLFRLTEVQMERTWPFFVLIFRARCRAGQAHGPSVPGQSGFGSMGQPMPFYCLAMAKRRRSSGSIR